MTVGLIINPLSGRRSGKGEKLRRLLANNPSVEIAVLKEFDELPAVLRHMAAKGVDILAISSGDGTIHAVQSELAENRPFAVLPRLVLLSHGTANMSAGTLGLNCSTRRAAQLLSDRKLLEALPAVVRPTLRVANSADGRIRHGMFLGTGAVYEATAYCQRILNRAGLAGNAAIVATFVHSFMQAVLARSPKASMIRSYDLRVLADGQERFARGSLLFLATTLDKLVLSIRPFWGGRSGPIRATAIPFPAGNPARWLLPGLYGSERRRMPDGALSFCATSLEIHGSTPYVMDGEFFAPAKNLPLHVKAGPDFIYLRG
jgi:diacylglycerol kinase (ATP)